MKSLFLIGLLFLGFYFSFTNENEVKAISDTFKPKQIEAIQ